MSTPCTTPTRFSMSRSGACLLAVVLTVVVVGPAPAEIATVPVLATARAVAPNVMFTLDDSGSMQFECLPDANCIAPDLRVGTVPVEVGSPDKQAVASYDSLYGRQMRTVPPAGSGITVLNPLYYDPEVRYLPWLKADGSRFPNSIGTAAAIYPEDGGASPTIDLTTAQSFDINWCSSLSACAVSSKSAVVAQYFRLSSGDGTALGHFTQIVISSSTPSYDKAETRTDCAGSSCTYAEELRNFANWFSYYRTRARVAIAGTAEAFASIPPAYRVGYGRINKASASTIDGVISNNTIERGVRPFTGADRSSFYTWLFERAKAAGNTPLRRATNTVGQYFSRSDDAGPWGKVPGTNDTTAHLTCRRSFHLLMTDGGWNGDPADTAAARANVDNTSGSTITGPNSQSYTYLPAAPFRDLSEDTLADVAMHYWNRDLRPDLANGVVANEDNPAFWQHLVNHTISFGINGTLANPGDLLALTNASKAWPAPTGDASKIDDLWHASVNSRGRSISARNWLEYATALQTLFNEIATAVGSEAGVAVSSRGLSATTRKYVPSYDATRWSGDLVAVSVPVDGSEGSVIWRAVDMLPAPASRNIFTWNKDATGTKGIAFTWANLSNPMKTALHGATTGGEPLVDFLRGDRSNENSSFRPRASALGDIVNSTPVLVKDLADGQYDFLPAATAGRSTYRRFVLAKAYREPQLFVGANDGMLHAFADSDGSETFAFMPGAVLGQAKSLSSKTYAHRFLVDGPLVEADVYDSSASKWRNLVAGSGGAGVKNLFAVNVPVTPYPTTGLPVTLSKSESAPGASDILWEVDSTTTGFAELGHVLQAPEFGTTRDGQWVMVVGNGYASSSGKAQLFVINALTGALIRQIDTGVGSSTDLNGLGGVKLMRDSYQRIVAAYAGDLKGNVWKFDLSASAPASWDVAFGGTAGTPRNPLITITNAAGEPEPITAAPTLALHPLGGVQVLAGTGKLFETDDPGVTERRSLFGVWDRVAIGASSTNAADRITDPTLLVAQTVSSTKIAGTVGGNFYSVTSNTVDYGSQRGWKLPLTMANGQRLIYDPQLSTGRVFFETMVPSIGAASCTANSITRYGFFLDPFMGGPGGDGPRFDTTGDGSFTSADNSSAGAFQLGAGGRSGLVSVGNGKVGILSPEGGMRTARGATTDPRRYWRQIINPPV